MTVIHKKNFMLLVCVAFLALVSSGLRADPLISKPVFACGSGADYKKADGGDFQTKSGGAAPYTFDRTSETIFEGGQVKPIALSTDGTMLFVANTPANCLEIYDVRNNKLQLISAVSVGVEPVSLAVRDVTATKMEVWVVNHISDSVSIVSLDNGATPTSPLVRKTLLVGDEPRDIVFGDRTACDATNSKDTAFITTANRGRNHPTFDAEDLLVDWKDKNGNQTFDAGEEIGRASVFVYDAVAPTTPTVVPLFSMPARALAVSKDGCKVYAAALMSGNQTTLAIDTGTVANGGSLIAQLKKMIFGNSQEKTADGLSSPEDTRIIVRYDPATGKWKDGVKGADWSDRVGLQLADNDVFEIDATTAFGTPAVHNPDPATSIDKIFHGVGTTLFNMVVNPVYPNQIYVSNTEARNDKRYVGPSIDATTPTVMGHFVEHRVTVLNESAGTATPHHLNDQLVTDADFLSDTNSLGRSMAQPVDMVVSSTGDTLYVANFGSKSVAKIHLASGGDLPGAINAAGNNTEIIPMEARAGGPSAHPGVKGGGPAGLALNGNTLYVYSRFDNAITSIDVSTTSNPAIARVEMRSPESDAVKNGRPFMYDASMTSKNGTGSCGGCHIYGDMDMLAWDLGKPTGKPALNALRFSIGNMGDMNSNRALRGFIPPNAATATYDNPANVGTSEEQLGLKNMVAADATQPTNYLNDLKMANDWLAKPENKPVAQDFYLAVNRIEDDWTGSYASELVQSVATVSDAVYLKDKTTLKAGDTVYICTHLNKALNTSSFSSLSRVDDGLGGGTVTVTTASAHSFAIGDFIDVSGVPDNGQPTVINGTWKVSSIGSNSFTYKAGAGAFSCSSNCGNAVTNRDAAITLMSSTTSATDLDGASCDITSTARQPYFVRWLNACDKGGRWQRFEMADCDGDGVEPDAIPSHMSFADWNPGDPGQHAEKTTIADWQTPNNRQARALKAGVTMPEVLLMLSGGGGGGREQILVQIFEGGTIVPGGKTDDAATDARTGPNNFHPLKGPMTTQTLRGIADSGPLHWRGDKSGGLAAGGGGKCPGGDCTGSASLPQEKVAFKQFNEAFVGLLGRGEVNPSDCSSTSSQPNSGKGLCDSQMNAFADFVMRLTLPPNPIAKLDGSLPNARAEAGKLMFEKAPGQMGASALQTFPNSDIRANCNNCHTLSPTFNLFGTDKTLSFETAMQPIKVPHLRNVYQKVGMFYLKDAPEYSGGLAGLFDVRANRINRPQVAGFGYTHDGQIDTLVDFFNFAFLEVTNDSNGLAQMTREHSRNMAMYMLAFDTNEKPIVGQQVTLSQTDFSGNANTFVDAAKQAQLNVIFDQALLNNCDLVKTNVDSKGVSHSYAMKGSAAICSVHQTTPAVDEKVCFDTDNFSPTYLSETDGVTKQAIYSGAMEEVTFTCLPKGNNALRNKFDDVSSVLDTKWTGGQVYSYDFGQPVDLHTFKFSRTVGQPYASWIQIYASTGLGGAVYGGDVYAQDELLADVMLPTLTAANVDAPITIKLPTVDGTHYQYYKVKVLACSNGNCSTTDWLNGEAWTRFGPGSANVDSDGDGVIDSADAFPNNSAASVDADLDGKPDAWNVGSPYGCSTTEPTCNGLTLDRSLGDKDNDGLSDAIETGLGINSSNRLDPPMISVTDSNILGIDWLNYDVANSLPLAKVWNNDGSWQQSVNVEASIADFTQETGGGFCILDALGPHCFGFTDPAIPNLTNGVKARVTRLDGDLLGDDLCVLTTTPSVICAHLDGATQLPVMDILPSLFKPLDIAAGPGFACAVDQYSITASDIKCWGNVGATKDIPINPPIPLGVNSLVQNALAIAAGDKHLCAIIQDATTAAKSVKCWGDNSYGQTVVPSSVTAPVSIDAGQFHTCVVNGPLTTGNSKVICWGAGTATRSVPTYAGHTADDVYQSQVPASLTNGTLTPVTIRAGGHRTCAAVAKSTGGKAEDDMVCWPIGISVDHVTSADSDADGIPDWWEVENGLNPLLVSDAALPAVGDSLSGCTALWTNLQIYQHHLNPAVCNISLLLVRSDYDGDGTSDLMLRDYSPNPPDPYAGQWTQFKMLNGTVSSSNPFSGAIDVVSIAALDVNGDGVADELVRDSTGAWYVYLVKNGQQNGVALLSALPTSSGWTLAAAGDFNRDGTEDILLRNGTTWQVYYMQNGNVCSNNCNLPTAPPGLTFGSNYIALGAADMDGDGYADLLLSSDSGSVRTWTVYNFVTNTATTPTALNSGPYNATAWQFQALVDLNADAKVDIVLRNTSTGAWTGFTMGSNFSAAAYALTNLPTASTAVLASYGDYNGDGAGDLLLHDSATNQYSMYLTSAGQPTLLGPITLTTPGTGIWMPGVNGADTDSDGMADWWEAKYAINPWSNSDATTTATNGLTYLYDYQHGLNPTLVDNDGDGLTDLYEVNTTYTRSDSSIFTTDPSNVDSDKDGLSDGTEVNLWHTEPLVKDTDGDGVCDGNSSFCPDQAKLSDNCKLIANPLQVDDDPADHFGNACDGDVVLGTGSVVDVLDLQELINNPLHRGAYILVDGILVPVINKTAEVDQGKFYNWTRIPAGSYAPPY